MKTNLATFINMVLSVRLKWDSISVHLLFLHHLILFLLMPHRMGGRHAKKSPLPSKHTLRRMKVYVTILDIMVLSFKFFKV